MRIEDKQRLDRLLGWWLLLLLRPVVVLAGKFMRRDHRCEPAGEIVVLKMVGGGNLLMALPALLGLRRRYPTLRISLVCGGAVAPFGELIGVFDRIEVIDDRAGLLPLLLSGVRTLSSLLRRRVDTIVDFEVHSVLSTVFSLMTCARNRIGFYLDHTYWRRNILTHLVFFNRAAGTYHFYDAAIRLLEAEPASMDACREHLAARVSASLPANGFTDSLEVLTQQPFMAVGAGCSDFGSVRLLPVDEWRAFARGAGSHLIALRWVFLGGAADRQVSETIARALDEEFGPTTFRYANLCGELPLDASLLLLKNARHFLGIDSALLHAARLFRVPSVSFWGPTHPTTRLRPIDGFNEEIHHRPPICSPCLHVAETPPCKGDNVCMRLFTRHEARSALWCEDAAGVVIPLDSTSNSSQASAGHLEGEGSTP